MLIIASKLCPTQIGGDNYDCIDYPCCASLFFRYSLIGLPVQIAKARRKELIS